MYDSSPFPYGYPPPVPPKKNWYQRPAVMIPTGIVAFLLLIGAIGAAAGAGKEQNNNAGAPQTVAPVTVERTVTAPASTSVAAARPAVETPAVEKSTKAPAPVQEAADSWTMPNEVGHTLQDAQNNIQALTDDNIFFTDSTDATGEGRMQLLDANWKVCSQNVDPGSKITADSDIVFDAVKLSESCP